MRIDLVSTGYRLSFNHMAGRKRFAAVKAAKMAAFYLIESGAAKAFLLGRGCVER